MFHSITRINNIQIIPKEAVETWETFEQVRLWPLRVWAVITSSF